MNEHLYKMIRAKPMGGNLMSGRSLTRRQALLAASAAVALTCCRPAAARQPLRIGSLRFGSVNWLLETIEAEGLDEKAGILLERTDFASNQASTIALLSRSVDMIVSDWLWALRQRSEDEELLFYPYSGALGAILVPPDSEIRTLEQLANKRIGVAGSALDKSWLLLRAHLQQEKAFDPAVDAQPFYGAPPLLSEQIQIGRLDALLTYWNYAARLEAAGYRVLAEMTDILAALGLEPAPPLVGFVWHKDLAEHFDQLPAWFRAVEEAQAILLRSDETWERLRPLMQIERPEEFTALRDRYRAGISGPWQPAQEAAAQELFELLRRIGGEQLLGPNTSFDPQLFASAEGSR